MNKTIEKIEDQQLKEKIAKEILLDLPEWFGLPESTQEYIEEAKELPFWVAKDKNKYLGFITLKETSIDSAEIHCMGVKKEYHRGGVGNKLIKALESIASENYIFLQVKTVAEGHYENYDQTISFYKKMGFRKLEVIPDLWDEWNPCLIMIKKL